jgi:hypothetical protein
VNKAFAIAKSTKLLLVAWCVGGLEVAKIKKQTRESPKWKQNPLGTVKVYWKQLGLSGIFQPTLTRLII